MIKRRRYNNPSDQTQGSDNLILYIKLTGDDSGLIDQSAYHHQLLTSDVSGMEIKTTPQGAFWGMKAQTGKKARWVLNKELASRTVAYWAYRYGRRGHSWCMEGRNSANSGWLFGGALSLWGGENIGFETQAPNTCFVAVSNWDTQWKHIAYTLENGVCKMYINGALIKTETNIAQASMVCHNFGIRYDDGDASNNASAAFRNLRIYNKPLSASEINQLYLSERF